MTVEGMGPYQIANRLKEEKVLIPSAYLAQFNEGVNKNKTFKDVYGWGSSTICNILDKREYLGHTINFKTRKHFKDKKSHYVPEDEWTIFENTHEAIIDQETFDLAQKVRSKVRRYPDGWGDVAPLTGLLYCADCGGKMYVHRFNNGKRISQYTCSQYSKIPVGTLCKTQHRINESVVLELVKDLLKAIAEYAKHERAEFVRVVQEAQSSQQTAEVKKQRTRLATAKQRISKLEVLLCKIYEDNILGKLSDSRYATLDAQYEKEQTELTAEISTLEKAISDYEKHEKDADRFIALIDKYENFDELTIIPLGTIVTVFGTGSEMNAGAVITHEEKKIKAGVFGAQADFAFLDPEYSMSVPQKQVLSGAFDTLSHAMETYFGKPDANNLSDDINEAIMRGVIRNTRILLDDLHNYEARSELAWASAMAENGILKIGKVTDFQCHQMEHQLGAYTDCNHGCGLAVIHPVLYRHIYDANIPRFARFARTVWNVQTEDDAQAAREGVEALAAFIREIGLPITFAELGIPEDTDLRAVADSTNITAGCCKKLTHDEIYEILTECK